MKFDELNLHPYILDALRQLNISECTDIQKSVIPLILEGKDISGLSQTGTGKTFAFAIPLLDRLFKTKSLSTETSEEDRKRCFEGWNSSHFILVLAPTRELADQIHKSVLSLGKEHIRTALIYGGVEYDTQVENLKNGVDIVVGTPGRLIDLYKNHLINFRHVKAIVFDEADRMFDMGFKDDMVYVLQRAPQDRQILLFSATLNFDVLNTIYRFGANPVEINISRDQVKAGEVSDEIFHVGEDDKPGFLLSLITREKPKQTIIFSNFKNNIDRISQFLSANGVPAVGISSLLTQSQRERVLQQFKNENERNTLVATDVAARGLDIKGVDLVINYDMPDDAENYVHRIGRTGRAGAKGKAFSLVSDRDVMALSRIESYLKQKVPIGWIEDKDLIKDYKPLAEYNFRKESRVKKTGLAAVKAQIPSHGGGRGQRQHDKNRKPFPQQRHQQQGEQRHGHAQGQQRHQAEQQPPGLHRDRKLGRHQHQNQGQPANGSGQGVQNGHQKQKHPQHKQAQQQKSFRQKKSFEPYNRAKGKTRLQEGKLSQKIKNFFKGLFR